MAKAFKCDLCGKFEEGEGIVLEIIPKDFKDKVLIYNACDECMEKIFKGFNEIRSDSDGQ